MGPFRNQRLFSNHYLENVLPKTEEWRKIEETHLKEKFNKLEKLYQERRKEIENLNESQLEERWIRPILRILDHFYQPNPTIPGLGETLKHPDYALYPSEEDRNKKDLTKAVAIGEVKRYGRSLDKKLKTDPEDTQNPSLQISNYLWYSEVPWGILTDGRYWRIYERETSKRLDIFYEIDLDRIFNERRELFSLKPLEKFKYFYLFFSREAFPEFLKKVYDESLSYSQSVGEELKENVYQALKILAETIHARLIKRKNNRQFFIFIPMK